VNPRRILFACALALGLVGAGPAGEVGEAAAGPARTAKTAKKSSGRTTKKSAKKSTKKSARKASHRKESGKKTAAKGKKRSGKKRSAKTASRRHEKHTAKTKLCTTESRGKGRKARKKCRYVREFQGHGVATAALRDVPLEKPSGDLWVHAENLGEEVKVNLYRPDGSFDEASLASLDNLFRCKRTGEVRAVDPRLYEQLSRLQDHFDGKLVELVSGFRFAERDSSRHFHASAMDIRIHGVSIREMYNYAESLDAGGMGIGIYPRSGFIHVDFRAPGERSYRWTDYSPPGGGKSRARRKKTGRTARARKPTS